MKEPRGHVWTSHLCPCLWLSRFFLNIQKCCAFTWLNHWNNRKTIQTTNNWMKSVTEVIHEQSRNNNFTKQHRLSKNLLVILEPKLHIPRARISIFMKKLIILWSKSVLSMNVSVTWDPSGWPPSAARGAARGPTAWHPRCRWRWCRRAPTRSPQDNSIAHTWIDDPRVKVKCDIMAMENGRG